MVDINTIKFIIIVALFVLSALPLHKSVKFFKGKTNFPKTLLITFISGLIISAISLLIKFYLGAIIFIVLIGIYKKAFNLKWTKAIMVCALQFILITISSIIIALISGLLLKLPLFR
jgi:hypothetical protein